MARASRAAQLAEAPDRRPYAVTRSGMTGLQRYAQTWSGDNETSWKTLRFNLRMGLGLALSGVSNAGHDVGGFAGPRPDPELFLRWLQAGVLMPRFSIHSWNDDGTANEPWKYPEILPTVRRLMELRQRLVPFFHDLAWRYHREFEPMIRPLWLDHPDDPHAWHDGEEHLLGTHVLATPVVEPGVDRRAVYLPAGSTWFDVWSGETFEGGQTIVVAAPLDGPPPLFARAGSGILVDMAPQGFRPGAYRPGAWLFPSPGDVSFAWTASEPHEDAIEGQSPGGSWRIEGVEAGDRLTLSVERTGSTENILIRLPATERRRVTVNGPGSAGPPAG
jgi:alpha-glucosidase